MSLQEQIRALPRFMVVVQSREGWRLGHARREDDPVIHEAVRLEDVLALLDEEAARESA